MAEMASALPYFRTHSRSTRATVRVYNADVRSGHPGRLVGCRTLPSMPSTVSSLIDSAERGEVTAAEALFTTLYTDLRRLARYELSRRGGGITLTATALLHEAYLDISKRDGAMFVDRGRFMAYASRVMRGLIIDYARNRRAQKRGGRFEMTTLETDIGATVDDREKRIAADIDAAQQARVAADETEAAWRARMDAARAEAAKLSNEAKQASARETEAKVKKAADKLNLKLEASEESIRTALAAARSEIQGMAAEVTQDLVNRLTGIKVDSKDAAAAVKAEMNG